MTSAAALPLEARGVTKEFPGTTALNGVDFAVAHGRVHALIGENGAGKSTLVNILAGVETPTAGAVLMDGAPVRFSSVRDAAARGIGIIHQELQLFPNMAIADNLFVGREQRDRWGLVDHRRQATRARETLARLGQSLDPATPVGALPLGLQQLVEIARALVHDARILMMDEPTSALTSSEIRALFGVIRDLASHGVAIVYISHRLEELLDVAHDVTVLRDGEVVGAAPAADVDSRWIVERMTGRPSVGADRERDGHGRAPSAAGPAPSSRLSVRHLSLPARPGRTPLVDVSLDVAAGEIVGIYGSMGAGRTELFETLLGAHADATGRIELDGRRLDALTITERVEAGLCLVPEDRQAAGLVQTLSILENMTLSSLGRLARRGYLARTKEDQAGEPLRRELRIRTPDLGAEVMSLSGGNQQKVVLARGLMSRPRVLLLDEPTRGIDVGAKAEILELLRRLAASGLAVLFASSELEEVVSAGGRTLVMAAGRMTAAFGAGEATEAALASEASAGLDAQIARARGGA